MRRRRPSAVKGYRILRAAGEAIAKAGHWVQGTEEFEKNGKIAYCATGAVRTAGELITGNMSGSTVSELVISDLDSRVKARKLRPLGTWKHGDRIVNDIVTVNDGDWINPTTGRKASKKASREMVLEIMEETRDAYAARLKNTPANGLRVPLTVKETE